MQVAVIGAGLAGLCSAYSLLRQGCGVTVVDRRSGPGLETSFANAGLVTPSMSQPWNTPGVHRTLLKSLVRNDAPVMVRPRAVLSMGRWGLEFLRQSRPDRYTRNALRNFRLAQYALRVLDEIYGRPAAAASLRASGSMYIYRSARELSTGESETRSLAASGLRYAVLSARECVEREPLLARIEVQLAGGIAFPEDRSGDAHAFCQAVAQEIAAAGGSLRYGVVVEDLVRRGHRVEALRTNAGPVAADLFVIAAGSDSRGIARRLGIHLPVYPVKGYSLSIHSGALPAVPRLPIVDASLHTAITPIDGVLRVAGTAEFAGFDTSVSTARIRNLEMLIAKVYPDLAAPAALASAVAWAGLRPMSSDGVPVIGGTAVQNVFVNTGHGHLGWTLAAASGALLMQLMTGGAHALDPADYAVRA